MTHDEESAAAAVRRMFEAGMRQSLREWADEQLGRSYADVAADYRRTNGFYNFDDAPNMSRDDAARVYIGASDYRGFAHPFHGYDPALERWRRRPLHPDEPTFRVMASAEGETLELHPSQWRRM